MKGETLGMRLRRAREIKRYSQIEVGEATGIGNANISRYELDQTSPNLETLKALANFYQVSLDWIFGITDSPDKVINKELRDIGFEWVSIIEECRAAGLSPKDIEKLIEIVKRKNPTQVDK